MGGEKRVRLHTPPCVHRVSPEAVAPNWGALVPIWPCLRTVLDARREYGGALLRAEARDAHEHPITHRTALRPT